MESSGDKDTSMETRRTLALKVTCHLFCLILLFFGSSLFKQQRDLVLKSQLSYFTWEQKWLVDKQEIDMQHCGNQWIWFSFWVQVFFDNWANFKLGQFDLTNCSIKSLSALIQYEPWSKVSENRAEPTLVTAADKIHCAALSKVVFFAMKLSWWCAYSCRLCLCCSDLSSESTEGLYIRCWLTQIFRSESSAFGDLFSFNQTKVNFELKIFFWVRTLSLCCDVINGPIFLQNSNMCL